MSTEEWRPVPGFPNYIVSNMGIVKKGTFKTVAQVDGRRGYKRVHLRQAKGSKQRLIFVHRVVASAFIGTCPTGYQVNHIDNNPSNNTAENLEYVTAQENQTHSWLMTDRKPPHMGTRTHFAKLRERDVIQIRLMRDRGATYAEIASQFNTKPANVWHICQGLTWKHLL